VSSARYRCGSRPPLQSLSGPAAASNRVFPLGFLPRQTRAAVRRSHIAYYSPCDLCSWWIAARTESRYPISTLTLFIRGADFDVTYLSRVLGDLLVFLVYCCVRFNAVIFLWAIGFYVVIFAAAAATTTIIITNVITSRCMARWPLWHAALPDNYRQIWQKQSISTSEMYSTILCRMAADHYGFRVTKSIHFWRRYARKTMFTL